MPTTITAVCIDHTGPYYADDSVTPVPGWELDGLTRLANGECAALIEADAKRLAMCWNAHDELVEVLELVVGSLAFNRNEPINREVLRRVEAAITKATGA